MPPTFPKLVTVRLSLTEKATLNRLAAREQLSVSAMLRECLMREAVRPLFASPVAPQGAEERDGAVYPAPQSPA